MLFTGSGALALASLSMDGGCEAANRLAIKAILIRAYRERLVEAVEPGALEMPPETVVSGW